MEADWPHETVLAASGLRQGSIRGSRSTCQRLHQSVPQRPGEHHAEHESVRRLFLGTRAAEAESQILWRQSDSGSEKQVISRETNINMNLDTLG